MPVACFFRSENVFFFLPSVTLGVTKERYCFFDPKDRDDDDVFTVRWIFLDVFARSIVDFMPDQ